MLKKTILAIIALFVVFVIVVSMRPDDFKVSRSATMNAAPQVIFDKLNSFQNWPHWSPWEKLDPDMTRKYEGAPEGEGASYSWQGNKNVGEGRMTIVKSTPPSQVQINLEFLKPFEATHLTQFDIAPTTEGSTVTWSMTGKNNFILKAMGMFINMDELTGSDFERGLANLKAIVEVK